MTPLRMVTLSAKADRDALKQLAGHLAGLRRQGSIDDFDADALLGGDETAEIDRRLEQADLCICLLSAGFLTEANCMEQARRVLEDPGVTVVPILLRAVDLEGTGFERRQTLPRDGRPILSDGDADTRYADVVRELRELTGRSRRQVVQPVDADLLARAIEVCRLQEAEREGLRIVRRPGADLVPEFAEIRYRERRWRRCYLLRALPVTPNRTDLDALGGLLRGTYRGADLGAYAVLVHLGAPPDRATVRYGQELGIDIQHLHDYQGLIDFQDFLARQTAELERDTQYPPDLYIPHRMQHAWDLTADTEEESGNAIEELLDWLLDRRRGRLLLVLGESGVGKTFLIRELCRRMAGMPGAPTPVLLEMRSLEKGRSLDELIVQQLSRRRMRTIRPDAFRSMLAQGMITLFFDGFDELALRVTYDRAVEHFQTILEAVQGQAKVVLSSRTQHFRNDTQVKAVFLAGRTSLGKRLEGVAYQVVQLQRFDENQVLAYLRRLLGGDEAKAQARLALLRDIKDLLGLSENPRMLGFICQLEVVELRKAQEEGPITSARLYQLLLERWLNHEYVRAHPAGTQLGLSEEARWEAVEHLALHLWRQPDPSIPVEDLEVAVGAALVTLIEQGLPADVATHQVGSGTLLCRDAAGRFSFVHQSVLEWLVARVARRDPAVLSQGPMSDLMADFFAGLVGREAALAWAHETEGDPYCTQAAVDNAARIRRRLGEKGSEFRDLLQAKLREFEKTLKGREQTLFRDRLVADTPLTLREVGERYGISRERARQIEARMLARLKVYLKRELGDAVQVAMSLEN